MNRREQVPVEDMAVALYREMAANPIPEPGDLIGRIEVVLDDWFYRHPKSVRQRDHRRRAAAAILATLESDLKPR